MMQNIYKLFYIHGYQSSPDGDKAKLFKNELTAIPIKYRDVEPEKLVISDCLKCIYNEIKNYEKVILIGSSLGGFLAAKTALENKNVKKLILLNPAIITPKTNLDNHKDVPKRILKDMVEKRLFKEKIDSEIIIIRGTNDDVVPDNWVIDFAKFQEATVIFLKDDHRLSNNLKRLPKIILKHTNL